MELLIFAYAAVLCVVFAILIRITGNRLGYIIFFAILAVVLIMKGMA